MEVRIEILPEKKTISAAHGEPLSEALERHGFAINYPCGGSGTCGACKVYYRAGAPAPDEADERLISDSDRAAGARLACRAKVSADARIHIPGETRTVEPKILTFSGHRDVKLDPSVFKSYVEPSPPSVDRPVSDYDLVEEVAPSHGEPTITYLRELPRALRAGNFKATVASLEEKKRGCRRLGAEAGDTREAIYGVAVDIGTTTVAARLHSLRNGEELGVAALLNPQVRHGADLISRLSYAFESADNLEKLREAIVACLNKLIRKLCENAQVEPKSIYDVVVAGNAAMNHLFLGVPPEYIGLAPYTPVFCDPAGGEWKPADIGLRIHPEARIRVMPNIGGFVGGDTVAGLVVCEFDKADKPRLLIDIGTNCEIALGGISATCPDELLAASAPAGPALEGACISCGIRAESGAIHDAEPQDGALLLKTIDDAPARGLCGSGLVHVIAELKNIGVIGPTGVIVSNHEAIADPAYREFFQDRLSLGETAGVASGANGGERRVLLASVDDGAERDIWLTQRDVREFQLAKAAIAAVWKTLCDEADIEPEEVDGVELAGAFGNFIRVEAARDLGLVPATPLEKIRYIGNTALEGARLALLNRSCDELAGEIVGKVRFIELAGRDDFEETFALEMALGVITNA